MSQFLLIERIKVQNANAVSGFTWGFPAITHFLGFSHNLSRKLEKTNHLKALSLHGCVVIAHDSHSHTFETDNGILFTQYRSVNYLDKTESADKKNTPSIIEEAKMNMTVSLLIPIKGYLGGLHDELKIAIKKFCLLQRLAGGTILSIHNIDIVDLEKKDKVRFIKRKLLPGFVLQDRSHYLEQHFLTLKETNPNAELLDAWFDFIALKQIARPSCELIDKYFLHLANKSEQFKIIHDIWLEHKSVPYQHNEIPCELINHFDERQTTIDKKVLDQWKNYVNPDEKTAAIWEYVKKPETGFLVPIMTGYKAITKVFAAGEIAGTRDEKTDICFVESVHSIGEWQSVHRLKTLEHWQTSIWYYAPYQQDWYLCQQGIDVKAATPPQEINHESIDDSIYD